MIIAELESRILAFIDDTVEQGSDDELFAGGYLRGHITLAVSELELAGNDSQDALYHQVGHSLEKAIAAGELSPRDQALVIGLWDSLYQRAGRA